MIQTQNILGISLGTRTIGMAMIVNGELVDWYVKSFKGMWTEQKKELILDTIDRMLERYTVGAFAITVKDLAIKVPQTLEKYNEVRDLHTAVNLLAQQKGITTETFSITALKERFEVRNKRAMCKRVLELYPELQNEFTREEGNRNPYYTKLFESVLAAQTLILKN